MGNGNSKIFDEFLECNKVQSASFIEPGQTLLRRQYRARHSVEMAAFKCMDGRINFSIMTDTPIGIIQPFRNIGGIFDMGEHAGELLLDGVKYAVSHGKSYIVLVTYHWSKGSKERGCKGFNYDVDGARAYTRRLVQDIETIFGKDHGVVYPLQIGIETDEDALVIHGASGEVIDLSRTNGDPEMLKISLERLFPDMKKEMICSVVPLCTGNIKHIADVRAKKRPVIDIDHRENILGIGRGFDWHHIPNRMLIVGPYNYDLATPIAVAGRILLHNLEAGTVPREDGIALISSAVFRDEAGPERIRAVFKARSLARSAFHTLKKDVPDLIPFLDVKGGILNENTQLFTPIDLGF